MSTNDSLSGFATNADALGVTFVTFTTNLVTEVMNALVTSQTTQLEAYAELIQSLSGSVADYQKSVAGLQDNGSGEFLVEDNGGAISSFAANVLGMALDLSALTATVDITGNEELIAEELSGSTITAQSGEQQTIEMAVAATGAQPAVPLTVEVLGKFILEHLQTKVAQEYDLLKFVIKAGMSKIDITDGHILTKLFIELDASESTSKSSVTLDAEEKGWGWKAGVNGRLNWWKKGKSRSSVGFSASGGAHKQNISVKTVRSSDLSSTRVHAEMLGEVRINFASNSFPAAQLD